MNFKHIGIFLYVIMTASLVNGAQKNTITDRLLSDTSIMRTERIMSVLSTSIALLSMWLDENNTDYDSYTKNGFIAAQIMNIALNVTWYKRKKEPMRLLHIVPTVLCFTGILLDDGGQTENDAENDVAYISFAIGACGVIAKGCFDGYSLIKEQYDMLRLKTDSSKQVIGQ